MVLFDRLFARARAVDPAIAAILAAAKRSEPDLLELGDRLLRSGVEEQDIARALANPELVAWFFALPNPDRITLDESLVLIKLGSLRHAPTGSIVRPSSPLHNEQLLLSARATQAARSLCSRAASCVIAPQQNCGR